jgi:hypothetical protein
VVAQRETCSTAPEKHAVLLQCCRGHQHGRLVAGVSKTVATAPKLAHRRVLENGQVPGRKRCASHTSLRCLYLHAKAALSVMPLPAVFVQAEDHHYFEGGC